jgi:hypothetical protein
LADGHIAVVNNGSYEVRVFDQSGAHIRTIGERGDGPGQFRYPRAVYRMPADSFLVLDQSRTVSVFDSSGSYIRGFPLDGKNPSLPGERLSLVGQFADGSLLMQFGVASEAPARGLRRNRIRLIRVLLDGSLGGSYGDFDEQTSLSREERDYIFGPYAQATASDSTVWYGPGDRFELREIGQEGRVVRLIRLDRPARPVTTSDREAYAEFIRASVRGTPDEAVFESLIAQFQFAPYFPYHLQLQRDPEGNLWVQDYQPFRMRLERTWSVFASNGRYLGDVAFPAGFTVHEIGSDYVLGAWTDELGVEYVHVYPLEKPE